MGLDIDLVLAPVDGSDNAEEAVEYAIALAEQYGADLHLLYVLDQRVMQGLETGDVDAETVASQHRSFTDSVRDRLDGVELHVSSAAGFSVESLRRTPGDVILDCAEEAGADFLVVPRETPGEDVDATLGKAALYVLEYASQPVLSV